MLVVQSAQVQSVATCIASFRRADFFFFLAEVFFVNLVPGPLSFLCGEGLCNEVNSEASRKEIIFFLSLKILHDISKNTFSIWYIL